MSNYSPTGNPPSQTRGVASTIRAEFAAISSAVNSKGDISGQTWIGTHTFPATTYGVTAPFGSTGTSYATLDFVNAVATNAALPGQAVGFLRSNGSTATFGVTHIGYAQNEVKGADIPSAGTINLTAATGNFIHVTGTTTITAITIPVGAERVVIFDGILTLTHSASLLLPGGVNITTATNDRALIRGDTAGAIVVQYVRASAFPIVANPYLKVSDRKASGTSGGNSISSDITQTRTLNTVETNTIAGASLSGNQITLPAGTYTYRARAPAIDVASCQLFLYNVTDSSYTGIGANNCSGPTSAVSVDSTVSGQFTIASTKVFTLRHLTANAVGTSGLGLAIGSGQSEVYSEAIFEKVF